ncbi:MAG: transglutaminase domain-containing protein [Gemmatimonadetes bacterium]|nr:transglutaminase domain-containing protein [Gemmatimonadota bacterium]
MSASPSTPVPQRARAGHGRFRFILALTLLAAWGAGLTLLVRREFFQGRAERLAEAALRLSPGATFYVVEQGGVRIGFASTTIDTVANGIEVTDYFVADLPLAGRVHRASARSVVLLSRALALRTFDVQAEAAETPLRVTGRIEGDSLAIFAMDVPGQSADTQRVAVRGPVLVPTLAPLAMALGETPETGKTYRLPTFDPQQMQSRDVALRVTAESLFVVDDSAKFDAAAKVWKSAQRDTVRSWHVVREGGGFDGWVDAQGRVVVATQPAGITLRRTAYELAFENWRIARAAAPAAESGPARDVFESTAISAGVTLGAAALPRLRVRLLGVPLAGYALDGGRQTLRGDTLLVERRTLPARAYSLTTRAPAFLQRFRTELAAEPLLQSNDIAIVQKAIAITGLERDAMRVAEKLNRWVYDSLAKEVTFSVPNALQVLRTRRGDCNEHTQLYVALARAVGIPARIATGLAYVRGKFYYHAWPEVWLDDWVPVDPTFGQFPADAAHLRFVVGGLTQQAELLRLIGNLEIQIVEGRR